jgi:hypothetical protein
MWCRKAAISSQKIRKLVAHHAIEPTSDSRRQLRRVVQASSRPRFRRPGDPYALIATVDRAHHSISARRPDLVPLKQTGLLPTILLAQDGEAKAVCVTELTFGFLVTAAILSVFTAVLFALVHFINVRNATKS